ncbi:MAG: hypothetical protein AB7U20_21945 [Planctomycetaceae bacterium]
MRRPPWWNLFVPRASTNCSAFSRLASAVIQLPALALGLCLASGLLILLPVMVILLAGAELLLERRRSTKTPASRR